MHRKKVLGFKRCSQQKNFVLSYRSRISTWLCRSVARIISCKAEIITNIDRDQGHFFIFVMFSERVFSDQQCIILLDGIFHE